VLNGIAAALPIKETRGEGPIINTASVGAHWMGPTSAVYSAIKYAVWAISEGLRQESKVVRLTIISPGVVTTELGHDITDATSKSFLADLRESSLSADVLARDVLYAVSQPREVDVNGIIVRPIGQSF
jgi:NADP-dependent 3-hydroxy acid dehydrogenase YdfG